MASLNYLGAVSFDAPPFGLGEGDLGVADGAVAMDFGTVVKMVDFSYKLSSAIPEDAVRATPPPQLLKAAPPWNLTRERRSDPRSSYHAGIVPHDSLNRIGSASPLPQPVLRCKRAGLNCPEIAPQYVHTCFTRLLAGTVKAT